MPLSRLVEIAQKTMGAEWYADDMLSAELDPADAPDGIWVSHTSEWGREYTADGNHRIAGMFKWCEANGVDPAEVEVDVWISHDEPPDLSAPRAEHVGHDPEWWRQSPIDLDEIADRVDAKRQHYPTFWRIQDEGLPLSRSHRSTTWGEEDENQSETHLATSAVRTVKDLRRANPYLGTGAIDVVKFEGEEVGLGWDGEPVVIPSMELLRFRRTPQRPGDTMAKLVKVDTIRDLLRAGWAEVPTMAVLP